MQQEHCSAEIIEVIIEETNEINVKWNHLQPFMTEIVKHNQNAQNESKYLDNVGKLENFAWFWWKLQAFRNAIQVD